MFFSNPFHGAFGLDIGDLSLKLLQLHQTRDLRGQKRYEVKELRTTPLAPGLIVNGEIQQPEVVRKKILHLLGKEGGERKPINTPWVVADLPEPKTFIKMITVDSCPADVDIEDINLQAKQHLPFDLADAYLDWQIIPAASTLGTTMVVLGAVQKTIADSYTYLLKSAGLSPIALEIEAMSIARSMITADKIYTNEARAILDIGATRSSIIVYDRDMVQFSMNIDFSGELLTTAIMQGLNIDHETAESLKTTNGLAADPARPAYFTVVTKLSEKLILEVRQALEFYNSHFAHANPVTHITLCGGAALTKNLESFLTDQLKISANLGHAWKNLHNEKIPENFAVQGPLLSSAIGLALRACNNI